MAKRKVSKSAPSAPPKRRASRARAVYRSARGASHKSGLRWGEIALSALVGYEGDKIIYGSGIGSPIASMLEKNEYTNSMLDAQLTSGPGSGNTPLAASIVVNKTAGLAAILKSAYDVVKHKKLSESDKNILIPFGIGTVFDGPSDKKSSSEGVWK